MVLAWARCAAERVVDEDVAQLAMAAANSGIVLGLTALEARVLEDEHLAGLQRAHHRLGLGSDGRGTEGHVGIDERGQVIGRHLHAVLWDRDRLLGRPRWLMSTTAAP